MNIAQARTVLAETGWLPETPPDFREAVLARTELHEFARGEMIYRRGDPPGGLWGLASGSIAVEVGKHEGPFPGHFSGPGFWIGAAPMITGDARAVGLMARRASVLLHLPIAEFEVIAVKVPLAWRWLAILPLQQTTLAIGIAEDLMIRDPRRRALALLLRLSGRWDKDGSLVGQHIDASQEDLARIMNLSRTALGEYLRSFERQGLITRQYRRIEVHREAAEHEI